MRLGIIARADRGGLAAQTLDTVRWLQPDRVLVIDLGAAGRGPTELWKVTDAAPNADVHVAVTDATCHPTDAEVVHFVDGLDVIWSAETLYHPRFTDHAEAAGCATVLQANPELIRRDHTPPTRMWLPSTWEFERAPDARIMCQPIDLTRHPPRPAPTEVRNLFTIAAPAMLDRNGTQLTTSAMRWVNGPKTLTIHGDPRNPKQRRGPWRMPPRIRQVTMRLVEEVPDNSDVWPDEVDVFVLPRRYGGLSLPLDEAAARGLPIVTLDLPPQNEWVHPAGLVPAVRQKQMRMPGSFDGHGQLLTDGLFQCYKAAPQQIAVAINQLADDPTLLAEAAQASRRRAEALSWERQLPVWREALTEACR